MMTARDRWIGDTGLTIPGKLGCPNEKKKKKT
jgi:hypothetical protein